MISVLTYINLNGASMGRVMLGEISRYESSSALRAVVACRDHRLRPRVGEVYFKKICCFMSTYNTLCCENVNSERCDVEIAPEPTGHAGLECMWPTYRAAIARRVGAKLSEGRMAHELSERY